MDEARVVDVLAQVVGFDGVPLIDGKQVTDPATGLPLLGPNGQPRITSIPAVLGNMMVDLLSNYRAETNVKSLMASRIAMKIMDAMEADGQCKLGEPALGIIREAVQQNGAGMRLVPISRVLEAIGAGAEVPEV